LDIRLDQDRPIEYLNQDRIEAELTPLARQLLGRLDIYREIDSTNQVLLDRIAEGSIHGHVCLAEFQTAGRGRRGNRWIMPLGAGICMSLGWHFEAPSSSPTRLSLVTGIGIMRTLQGFGIQGAGIKWPNDVMWGGHKLGGVRLESSRGSSGFTNVIIGVGLNVAFPEQAIDLIDQPWIDIATIAGQRISRNSLTAKLLCELFEVLCAYEQQGWARFIEEWRRYGLLHGETVRLSLSNGGSIIGKTQGIDSEGALLVCVNGRIERYWSGEVSLCRVV
jgi:BirA family transcriptional regulator, biotin operon repressor / biotin---[acetyl-CoA-carboxylase] ligase